MAEVVYYLFISSVCRTTDHLGRDHCRCDRCVNQDTKQRAFETFSVRDNQFTALGEISKRLAARKQKATSCRSRRNLGRPAGHMYVASSSIFAAIAKSRQGIRIIPARTTGTG